MAQTGKLTLSGDLYEANFEDWKTRVVASLETRGLGLHLGTCANIWSSRQPEESKRAARHIRNRTSEAMLARVPNLVREHPSMLMEALEKLATPFRLFDLPAEIRNAIYVFALPRHHYLQDNSSSTALLRQSLPPLLYVNSQIRQEATSLFYANAILRVAPRARANSSELLKDRDMLQHWSQTILLSNAKFLHHIEFHVRGETSVALQFSEKDGLRVGFHYCSGNLTAEGQLMLDEHRDSVEATRKALNLKGESVMMALLANWSLWELVGDEVTEWDSDYSDSD